MNLGEHFQNVSALLARAELDVDDQLCILNNYAVGVQQALDARECPRCHERLVVKKDRLLSTSNEAMLVYSCNVCKLELSRPDMLSVPWWKRMFF